MTNHEAILLIHITYLAKPVSNCTGKENIVQNQHEIACPRTHLEQHCPVLLRVRGLNMTGCTCMSPAGLFQVCVVSPSLHHCSDTAAPGAKLLLLIKARVL